MIVCDLSLAEAIVQSVFIIVAGLIILTLLSKRPRP